MKYEVISCGVNHTPGGQPLSFAEKDAIDIAALMQSGLGPNPAITTLTGATASGAGILNALTLAAQRQPDYLLFYFSGHGSAAGVETSSGSLLYSHIIGALQYVNARHSMVILDVCSAGSYLGFLKEAYSVGGLTPTEASWLCALAEATPSNRVLLSAGVNRTAAEGGAVQNGHFTHCLLQTLFSSSGDVDAGGRSWISDQKAFVGAKGRLSAISQGRQVAIERHLTGDFPLVLSRADAPIGSAYFSNAFVEARDLMLYFSVAERRLLPTTVRVNLVDTAGASIWAQAHNFSPTQIDAPYAHRIPFPSTEVANSMRCSLQWAMFGQARLDWVLELLDEGDRVLDTKVVPIIYRRT